MIDTKQREQVNLDFEADATKTQERFKDMFMRTKFIVFYLVIPNNEGNNMNCIHCKVLWEKNTS